ncbi:hypothetical protein ACFLSV_07845 [Bacteroidota bacterium]
MEPKKALIDFSHYKDDELLVKGTHIYDSLNGNLSFPLLAAKLPSLLTALNEYSPALAASVGGSKLDTAVKNQKRDALIEVLRDIGEDVNDEADGDEPKIVSSGYDMSKDDEPVGTLPPPEDMDLEFGADPGEMVVKLTPAPRGAKYIVFYAKDPAPDDDKDWHQQFSTTSKIELSGLDSGDKYWFKGSYVTSTKEYNFTPPQSRIIQ